jgi:hypothetical protein
MSDQPSYADDNPILSDNANSVDFQGLSENQGITEPNLADRLKNLPPLPVAEPVAAVGQLEVDDSSILIGIPPKSGAINNSQLELIEDISTPMDRDRLSDYTERSNINSGSEFTNEIIQDEPSQRIANDPNNLDEDYSLMDANHVCLSQNLIESH